MPVPLQNIYYLLCYAWNRLEVRNLVDVDSLPGNRVENLLGTVLNEGVSDLIRRGLDRGYVPVEEEGRRLRGKLLVAETVNRLLLRRGRVACRTDELSYDVPHNRVVKAALRHLIDLPSLDDELRTTLRSHWLRLRDVNDVSLSPATFRKVQLHQNVARYAFLINISRLIARSLLPDQKTGGQRFYPFTASEQEMGRLFEGFVRNFLRREQDRYTVSAQKVRWQVDPDWGSDTSWLPEMRTDILLQDTSRRILFETKYYATPHQEHLGRRKLISGHLYQLLTYLAHMSADDGPEPVGVLLYADVGRVPQLNYRLGGFTLLVRSLNLNQGWHVIHRDLLRLVNELSQAAQDKVSA